ncbi:TetR/AcrR family transcriptional regulator [Nonomuraea sp. NPDC048916]|uniref:TetR/AcrR family transcriptional regulator n=1 Tax=Nonomuraea sp. NPDC048916 TaxID=3154232 RepID=UPI0033FBF833
MPKIVDHDQRRAELADVALDLIARHGIKAVTLRTVAETAGWSTGVLNHYFRSHNDLLVGALRRAAEIQGRMFKQLRGDLSTDPMQRLRQLVESVLPLDDRRIAMTRIFLVFYAQSAGDPEAREEVADYLHNWRRVVERVIVEAQRAGQLPSELEPARLAMELVALSDGLAMHAILDEQVLKQLTKAGSLRIELVENSFKLSIG